MTVPLDEIPGNLEIVWDGVTEVNECDGTESNLIYDRTDTGLEILVGGIGYQPPTAFSLRINDLGDCDGTSTPVVAVDDYPVEGAGPGYTELCEELNVTL